MQEKMKKKWVKPILTVLTRGEDGQERVLETCKNILWEGAPGPLSTHANCRPLTPPCINFCSSELSS